MVLFGILVDLNLFRDIPVNVLPAKGSLHTCCPVVIVPETAQEGKIEIESVRIKHFIGITLPVGVFIIDPCILPYALLWHPGWGETRNPISHYPGLLLFHKG